MKKLSEKYFEKHFSQVINVEGCVIASPEAIKTYAQICNLEGQLIINPRLIIIKSELHKIAMQENLEA